MKQFTTLSAVIRSRRGADWNYVLLAINPYKRLKLRDWQ
jgi:hypothetical protein